MAPHHALGTMGKPSMSKGETSWPTMQELFNIEQFCPIFFKKSKLSIRKIGMNSWYCSWKLSDEWDLSKVIP
jgi:hypothetical protein